MNEQRRARLVAYGVAVLATGLSVLLRLALFDSLGSHAPFITFLPVVIVSAYIGGLRPGLLATLLGAAAADYFLVEPRYSVAIYQQPGEAFAIGLFVLIGVALSMWGESRLHSRRRVEGSERRYAVTLASIGDAVIATDNQARVTFVNPAAEALTGWPQADAVGRPLAEVFRIVNEQTRQPVEDPAAKVLRSGTVVGLANHTALLARDGREVPIDDCGAPILDDRGVVAGVVLVFRDVTERRQAEEAEVFRRANQRMELALRGSNVGVWDHETPDADYRRRRRYYVNVWEQLGYEGSPPGGETPLDAVHPDDRLRVEEAVRRYLAGESTEYETEARFRHRDGSYRTLLTRGVAVRDAAGKPLRFLGVTVDVTQLKLAEEALRESEERFRGTFENAAVGIVHNDPAGPFLRVNQRFCEIVGYSREELLQKTLQDIIHPEDLAAHVELYASCFTRGEPPAFGMERRYLRKDGRAVWVEAFASFQRDASGRPAYVIAAVQDISERKRLEGELRQTTALLQGVADGTQDAVYVKDREGRHLMFNAAASRMVGKPIGEVLGRDDTAIFDPDGARLVMAHDRRVMESGVADTDEKQLTAGGVTRTYLASKAPYRDGQGNIVGIIGICHDITERKHAEEALRQANARLDLAVRGSNISIWECDMPDGRIENSRLTLINVWELLGYDARTSPADFPSTFALLFHPDDQKRVMRELEELFASDGEEYESEYRVRTKDGSTRWHLARGTVLRDLKGTPVRFIGTSADITDLKRAEGALRESEERFRQLAENVRGVFWLQEGGWGRLLYISPDYEEIWGRRCHSLYEQPRSWINSVHPEDRDLVVASLERQNRGAATETEFRITRPDGSIRWVRCGAFPLRNQVGEVYRAAGLAEDITERKQIEEELRRAKEAAEAANRAKDDFLANVSHEIRTPMNAILGMTELVLDTPLEEDQRQGLKTVKSAADSLLGIINDLLDFSKIEAGKLELVPADFSLRGVVGDTLRALAVRAHKKGLELIYQVQPDVPDALVGDPGRLRQVLLNLVGNAVKFTDEGEVVVRVEIQGGGPAPSPGAGEADLRFTVRDTGIGIPPDQQERIFRAFEQEDTSTTRKYGGTGLGLTIASRLVALIGGTVTVDSAPGQGSTFTFTAHFGRQPHPPEPVPAQPPVSLHDLPVLVVDDNATNRHILAEWLRGWQLDPTAVGDGMAAMDALWHRAANGRPYALVLLDARMPDADGLTVAAKIRERAELAATRIILLTSGERPGDPARTRELRIDAQLLKPVQQDELLEAIFRVMSRYQGNAPPLGWPTPRQQARTAPVPATTPLHILVAEDNELSAQVLEQSLVRQGHRVRLASNGREVLTLAEQGGFDLLLLDVHMPELDGFQVVQAVRERELTAGGHLPIIALTARSRKEDRERCLAAGMDDFQTKPIRPADLLAAIDRVLRTHSFRQSRRRDLLDAPVLLAACGGDPTLLGKMCQTLTARVPEHLAALRDALRDQDAPRLREAAHKCCGMLSEFSAAAGNLAGSLEDLAAGTQLDKAAPILEQLETIAQELVKQVDGITVEALRRQAEGMDKDSGTAGP